jgi:hypothetical protein
MFHNDPKNAKINLHSVAFGMASNEKGKENGI